MMPDWNGPFLRPVFGTYKDERDLAFSQVGTEKAHCSATVQTGAQTLIQVLQHVFSLFKRDFPIFSVTIETLHAHP